MYSGKIGEDKYHCGIPEEAYLKHSVQFIFDKEKMKINKC